MKTGKVTATLNLPIPELRGSIDAMKYPAFGEIKFDGEFTFVMFSEPDILTVNKYGRVRTHFPELERIGVELATSNCKSAVMLAELFYGQGKRNALYDLNSNKESDGLHLVIFDILESDGKNIMGLPLIDRKEELAHILPVHNILPKIVNNKTEAEMFFDWTVKEGYEGAVIKSLDSALVGGPCDWVKMKMKDQNDYIVTLIDPTQERIEVGVWSNQAGLNKQVSVGVKAPMRYKRHIKLGDMVTIEHQGMLDSGSLRHPVLIPKKEWK